MSVVRRLFVTAAVVALALAVAGCGGEDSAKDEEADMETPGAEVVLTVASGAFGDGESIPRTYTCEGKDVSPPLSWEGVPQGAQSLVLIVDDPDAPDPEAPQRTWVHWVLYNIPVDTTGLPEAVAPQDLPAGTEEGLNDWQRTGYGGPCPPIGRHRYFFKLYALDTKLTGLQKPTKAEVEAAMEGHIIAEQQLIGTYEKTR
jgi:Raf kinase inhibitor-like YbhB/YbcL family protein